MSVKVFDSSIVFSFQLSLWTVWSLDFLRDPVYDNSRVTKDVKVIDRPTGSKKEGGP
jgi:hypothetical protein